MHTGRGEHRTSGTLIQKKRKSGGRISSRMIVFCGVSTKTSESSINQNEFTPRSCSCVPQSDTAIYRNSQRQEGAFWLRKARGTDPTESCRRKDSDPDCECGVGASREFARRKAFVGILTEESNSERFSQEKTVLIRTVNPCFRNQRRIRF